MKKVIVAFEISMLVLMSFSFAYIIGESNELFADYYGGTINNKGSKFVSYLRGKALEYLSNGLVSGQGSGGATMQTCVQNVNGTICQEYSSLICENQCATACIPATRENTAECRIGTCFDPLLGTCNDGTPKFSCENANGVWSATRPAQCNRNCCLINPDGQGGGEQARYTTQQECNYLGQTLGLGSLGNTGARINWIPVGNEVECLLRANSQAEGACILEFVEEEQAYNCEFTTQSNCYASGGDFYESKLCTNPSLDTICEITQETSCIENKDEVYFVDTCGNRANIYDSTKLNDLNYWSNVVQKSDGCALSTASNPLGRQEQCGNCEYLLGTKCGASTNSESAFYGNYVCRDLSCVDEWGYERKHGESWCAFDSKIGVDGPDGSNYERSVDVPGSRHYKKICYEGDVRTEACADYRNEVCVEGRDEEAGFSQAVCRLNPWQQCLDANDNQRGLNECEEKSFCFLKHVDIGDYFEFDVCVAKHPPAWDLSTETGGQIGEDICAIASQSCTYIEEKKVSGWECVANCECLDREFSETMNNLCISLGDCGGHINLAGEFTSYGYGVSKAGKRLSGGYVNGLKRYKDPERWQKVDPLTAEELRALYGIANEGYVPSEVVSNILGGLGLGALGGALIYTAVTLGGLGAVGTAAGAAVTYEATVAALVAAYEGLAGAAEVTAITNSMGNPIFEGFGNALLGVAIGAAIGFILAKVLGVQGQGVLIVMLGGAAGAGIALALGETLFSTWFFGGIGIGTAVALLLVFVLGIGDTRERTVSFACMPWQPPTGGDDCEICNEDELPCSKYKCQSLGQSCQLINEGTGSELCININPNDVTAPNINANEDVLSENYRYADAQENVGVKVRADEGDGCIKEYNPVQFGIFLDEPGQCKFDTEHTANFEEMSNFFEGNLFMINHTKTMAMPLLSELGVSGVGPDRRGQHNLYVRCQDANGNFRGNEYVVNFCVKPADDVTAPVIREFVPPSPGAVGLNVSEFNLQFYTNEPATCRWGLQDKEYSQMENNVMCLNELSQVSLRGWNCLAVLSVSGNMTSNYYFRCADQPWLGQNLTGLAVGRNINAQSATYQLQKTNTPLEIYDVTPNGQTLSFGSIPATAVLQAKTRGGLNNNALCEYSFNNGVSFSPFFETGGQTHRNTFNQLIEQTYSIAMQCTDTANNVATGNTQFVVDIDDEGPVITRVYRSGGSLNIITNERSQCAYSNENCAFSFGEGTLMNGQNYLHSASINQGITYRIKCEDSFGNVGQCLSVSAGY